VRRRLTALDTTFLELEDADRSAHMHIGGLLVFDGPPPGLEAVRAQLLERLEGLPRYRQRLSARSAGGLRRPVWRDDPDFDVATHVTSAALPKPGGEAELLEWAGDFYSHRLDRARPLWRTVVLEGLADGRWALATKTHHCLVDGVGATDAATIMLDATRSPGPWQAPSQPPEPTEHSALYDLTALPGRAARSGLDLAAHPARAAALLDGARGLVELALRDELAGAPQTSLNVPLGEHRRLAVGHVELARVKAIGRALGGTVNDVVLALVTAGLRRLLLERGEEPPAGVRAMVPVSLRTNSDAASLGNRVSSLFVTLPVDEPDPGERYRLVLEEAERRKSGRQAVGSRTLLDLSALAPPALHAALARPVLATRLFNLTVTNVPGPPQPLYGLGHRLRTIIPLVPLAAGHAVGVAIVSYAGDVCLCVNADRDVVRDAAEMIAGVEAELEALEALAAHPAAPA
jgi:diacylglycerol O-acyltransferase / wax synthase